MPSGFSLCWHHGGTLYGIGHSRMLIRLITDFDQAITLGAITGATRRTVRDASRTKFTAQARTTGLAKPVTYGRYDLLFLLAVNFVVAHLKLMANIPLTLQAPHVLRPSNSPNVGHCLVKISN